MSGSSNAFVVSPAGLCVEATEPNSSCATDDVACSKFKAAGEEFGLNVSARQWAGSDDDNYCDNGITPNFKLNDIDLTSSVIAPVDGDDGDLKEQVVSIASNGEATITDQSISEVGLFTITAETPDDAKYLGQDISLSGTSATIGRFYPAHFVLSDPLITERSDIDSCMSDFSYMGENFEASFNLTAQNTSGDQTTNYAGNFARLDQLSELELVLVSNPVSVEPGWDSRRVVNDTDFDWPPVGLSDAGQGLVTLELALKRKENPDGPYDALTVAIAPDDGDTKLNSASFDTDASGNGSNDHAAVGDPTQIRYGRMQIQNTYGPETSSLNQPVFIQYYDGTGFVTNTDDSCTLLATGNITLQVDGESALSKGVVSNVSIGSGTTDLAIESNVDAGEANLTYTATGAGNTGAVTMTYDVPEWLQFNWGGSNDPSATATFGRFRGSDRVIYWLEQ